MITLSIGQFICCLLITAFLTLTLVFGALALIELRRGPHTLRGALLTRRMRRRDTAAQHPREQPEK